MATRTLRCSVCDLEWGYSGHPGCGRLFADGRREKAHPIADGSAAPAPVLNSIDGWAAEWRVWNSWLYCALAAPNSIDDWAAEYAARFAKIVASASAADAADAAAPAPAPAPVPNSIDGWAAEYATRFAKIIADDDAR